MKRKLRLILMGLLLVAVVLGCTQPGSSIPPAVTYTVTYSANCTLASGSVPTDSKTYQKGATVTVLGNTGNMVRTGYTFAGWNTQASGSGTTYAAGATFTMGTANVTLYAMWTQNTPHTVTYNANGATGSVPTDSNTYLQGATVTVLGNTGNLVSTGNVFAGWTTSTTGPGASYAVGATFTMGTANVTLHAVWIPSNLTFTSSGTSITITGSTTGNTLSGALIIPVGVTSIGSSAFSGYSSLTSVTVPPSVTSIGASAFLGCSGLTSVSLSIGLTSIGQSAFQTCTSLPISLTLPSSVTTIGEFAFWNDSISVIYVPASVTSIGDGAFASPDLGGITLDPANPSYEEVSAALYNKAGTTLVEYPAMGPSSYTPPSSVTSFADYAFAWSVDVSQVTIPATVTNVGDYTFMESYQMTITLVSTTPPTCGPNAFYLATYITVYVPSSALATYKAAPGWDAGDIVLHIYGY